MKRLLAAIFNLMAGFMDFGVGMLITSLIAYTWGYPLTWWQLIIGGTLGFLPDFDIAFTLLRKGTFSHNHHLSFMHRPLLVLPVVGAIAGIIGGPFWMVTAIACVFWHYCHDSPPLGLDGIAWLWPFSDQYVSYHGFAEPKMSMDHPTFIRNYWAYPSGYALWEISVGCLSLCGALLLDGYSTDSVVALAVLLWVGAFCAWTLHIRLERDLY